MTWLDAVILAYVALGAWTGLRLGLAGALASLLAYLAGFWAAGHLAGPLLGWAEPRYHLQARLAGFIGRAAPPAPLAGGGGTLYASQFGTLPGGAGFAPAAAALLLHYAAFAALLLAVHAAAWWLLRRVAAVAPRRGPLGVANALAGLAFGAAERVLVAAVAAGFAVSLGGIAAAAPLLAWMQGSRLVPWLLALFHAWEPAAAHWWATLA